MRTNNSSVGGDGTPSQVKVFQNATESDSLVSLFSCCINRSTSPESVNALLSCASFLEILSAPTKLMCFGQSHLCKLFDCKKKIQINLFPTRILRKKGENREGIKFG